MEEGIKHVIAKTQENCRITKVYQKKWDPDQGEVMAAYVHNPVDANTEILLGKIGSLIMLHCGNAALNTMVDPLAQ